MPPLHDLAVLLKAGAIRDVHMAYGRGHYVVTAYLYAAGSRYAFWASDPDSLEEAARKLVQKCEPV